MKKSIQSMLAIAMFGAAALAAQAQPAPKILVVDMGKLFDTHYKTQEQDAKIKADEAKAQEEIEKMNKEGNVLVEEYKTLSDKTSNPTLSAEAKSKAQDEAQKKLEQIQMKKNEIGTFMQNTRNSLGQRLNTFRTLMLEEISKVASEVAKRRGATLLLDRTGPTAIGISNVIYSDPAYDITEEVMKEINKDRPASATPPAPASTTAPKADSGAVTVPGLAPTKK